MNPKIKQQIEDKANELFPKPLAGRIVAEHNKNHRDTFTKGAKFGYNIKESVDVEMSKNIEIVLPSATSACKYNVQVKSMVGEILFEHTFYGDSKPLIKQQKQE